MIQGKSVGEATLLLQYLPKKAAKIVLKVVKSAVANATNNLQINTKDLIIKRVDVGKGPKLKRVRPV
jgi:large subunit ribosomal protein L22